MELTDSIQKAPESEDGEHQERAVPRLSFVDVHHSYGDIAALRGVTLDVAQGEIVCLLGHSGCGKTTLLRIGAGVERQVAGQVLIDGQEVSGSHRFDPPERRGVGLMFQDYALFPHLTILKNVMFGLADRPSDKAESMARAALWSGSVYPNMPTPIPMPCPAASSSGPPWQGLSPRNRVFC